MTTIHTQINADTARTLVRDAIAFTRGMPSAAYLEEVLTELVRAAMMTDGPRATFTVNDRLSLCPTVSYLADGHLWVEWKLMTA